MAAGLLITACVLAILAGIVLAYAHYDLKQTKNKRKKRK